MSMVSTTQSPFKNNAWVKTSKADLRLSTIEFNAGQLDLLILIFQLEKLEC